MNHITKRLFSLVLVVFMLTSIVGTASAATVSWTSNGYSYVGTVNKGSAATKYFYLPETEGYHTYGYDTIYTATASNGTNAVATVSEFPSDFRSNLTNALFSINGLVRVRTIQPSGVVYATAESTQKSGIYGVYAGAPGNAPTWQVERNSIDLVDAGTLSFVPYNSGTCIYDAIFRRNA